MLPGCGAPLDHPVPVTEIAFRGAVDERGLARLVQLVDLLAELAARAEPPTARPSGSISADLPNPMLFLFDIDGTLILTGGAGFRAFDRALVSQCGFSCPQGLSFAGKTDPLIIEEIYQARTGRAPHRRPRSIASSRRTS